MPLKRQITDLEEVEEAYRPLYEAVEGEEGVWRLKIEVEPDPEDSATAKAAKAAAAARAEKRAAEKRAKDAEDKLAEIEAERVAAEEKAAAEKAQSSGDWESIMARAAEKADAKLTEATTTRDTEIARLKTALEHAIGEAEIGRAMVDLGILSEYAKPFRLEMRDALSLDWPDGEPVPTAMVHVDDDLVPFAKWASEVWTKEPHAPHYQKATVDGGGGANGSGTRTKGQKAWKDMTLTEQSSLVRADPVRAGRMQKEAAAA